MSPVTKIQESSVEMTRNATGVSCVVCGGSTLLPLTVATGELAYCTACLHAWRTTRPSYPYAQTAMCAHDMGRARYEAQIGFFSPFLPENARILELGCATGELAAATREALRIDRYDAIEMSPAGKVARSRLDNLYVEPLRDLLQAGAIDCDYDLVILSHVLEHLEDLSGEIEAIKSVLAARGAIFIEVPNRSGNPKLPIDDNIAHFHFFTMSSLTRLMAQGGLDTLAARTGVRLDARCTDALQIIARPFELPTWSKTFLSDRAILAGEDRIVVWGAGGLVENLLANFFDASRIDFFIDRDGGKRDWRCLDRPIRLPDALGDEPRTILINSVDFADAIAADIARVAPDVDHRVIRISELF